jgi:hypothetical protein
MAPPLPAAHIALTRPQMCVSALSIPARMSSHALLKVGNYSRPSPGFKTRSHACPAGALRRPDGGSRRACRSPDRRGRNRWCRGQHRAQILQGRRCVAPRSDRADSRNRQACRRLRPIRHSYCYAPTITESALPLLGNALHCAASRDVCEDAIIDVVDWSTYALIHRFLTRRLSGAPAQCCTPRSTGWGCRTGHSPRRADRQRPPLLSGRRKRDS